MNNTDNKPTNKPDTKPTTPPPRPKDPGGRLRNDYPMPKPKL